MRNLTAPRIIPITVMSPKIGHAFIVVAFVVAGRRDLPEGLIQIPEVGPNRPLPTRSSQHEDVLAGTLAAGRV